MTLPFSAHLTQHNFPFLKRGGSASPNTCLSPNRRLLAYTYYTRTDYKISSFYASLCSRSPLDSRPLDVTMLKSLVDRCPCCGGTSEHVLLEHVLVHIHYTWTIGNTHVTMMYMVPIYYLIIYNMAAFIP
jgi:hypothetical protein